MRPPFMQAPSGRFPALIIIVVLLSLTLSAAFGVILCQVAVHPLRRAVTRESEVRAQARTKQAGGSLSRASVTAPDGEMLRAWFYTPGAWNGHSVLVLHGVADNRESGVGIATLLLAHGYRVLTPDARAQGESGGDIATYGFLERDDVRTWVKWLRSQQSSGCIHALGASMGAAHLLQASIDPQPFCDVVAESSFESFREVAFDRIGQAVGTGPWLGRTLLRPAVEAGFLSARLRYHVELADANPSRALRATKTPVLVIHGLSDSNIPLRHALALAASNPEYVTLWLVPKATHTAAWAAAPNEYPARVLGFFAAHEQTRKSGGGCRPNSVNPVSKRAPRVLSYGTARDLSQEDGRRCLS